jgi:hypothetical protein
MSGYIGTKAVNLSTTGADINGNANVDGTLDVTGATTVTGAFTSLGIDDNATSVAITIDASENVGIGTASPTVKLHVEDTAGAVLRIKDTSSSYSNIHFADAAADYAGYVAYNHGTDYLTLGTSATERMRIDASGNVGLGTSTGIDAPLTFAGSAGKKISLYSGSDYSIGVASSELRFATSGFMSFYRDGYSGSESMRIDSSGNLLVGTTTLPTTGSTGTRIGNYYIYLAEAGTGFSTRMAFVNSNGTVGSITTNRSATAYNTSSDYRLKEAWVPMTGASERVLALKPINFAWKVDGSRVDGFLAHEAQAVVPECVTGTKDAMMDEEYEVTAAIEATYDEDGNELTAAVEAVMGTRSVPDMQGIDQSKLVPLLTAALQEALTAITDLKARVAALEMHT